MMVKMSPNFPETFLKKNDTKSSKKTLFNSIELNKKGYQFSRPVPSSIFIELLFHAPISLHTRKNLPRSREYFIPQGSKSDRPLRGIFLERCLPYIRHILRNAENYKFSGLIQKINTHTLYTPCRLFHFTRYCALKM
jgi:hypothetical protein